jgi:hypothetical protein
VRVETERTEHAFLVRTWREPGDASAGAEWRGSVEHLPSKKRRYFRELADLCAFILTQQLAENPEK